MLDDIPEREAVERLVAVHGGLDKLRAGRREVYLLCYQSVCDSKLAALGKLNTPMTARNWKTINKLCELLREC